jgi:DNA polymerase-1
LAGERRSGSALEEGLMAPARKRLVLIDTYSLLYRAFHALPPMSTSAGLVTNAVYGFTSMLAIVLADRPEYAVAAVDVAGPTFRSQEYRDYKQGRPAMGDDLRPQVPLTTRVLEALTIPVLGAEGFEADDVIGTLAAQAAGQGLFVTIVSGDLDCLQLVNERVEVLVPRRGITDTMVYGPEQVRQRYGLEPLQLVDFKALRGDTSDNIPGVPGVGEKTAAQLVQRFGSIEALLERLEELPEGRIRRNLEAARDQLPMAKRMVTIRRDVPVELDLARARWLRYDPIRVRSVFDELEFRQLQGRLPAPEASPLQPTLELELGPTEGGPVELVGPDGLSGLRRALEAAPEVALFGLWDASPRLGAVGFGLAARDGAWYVAGELVGEVADLLRGRPLVAHDVKETQLGLQALAPGEYRWRFSTHLAAYLLGQGARDPRLEDLAREFLGLQLTPADQLLGSGRSARPPSACPPEQCAEYAGTRARAVLGLEPRLVPEMRQLGVDYLFHEVELPLATVLAEMETVGVAIDIEYLTAMERELAEQLAALEAEVAQIAGHPLNLNAPQQLARLLFDELRLPVGKRTKTGYSTDAETLEGLRDKHPVVPLILDHRQLSKLKSTYVDALPALVDPVTGRLHTSFGQATTATGRLSSFNPNLMNIPIRTELGQRIRRAFQAQPGWELFTADYSQIDLRVAAHLSEDPQLLAAFAAGQDIHAATAALIFKVPIDQVTSAQRRLAKVANFGSIYGQGEYGLSQQVGISGEEARGFLREYWATYSRLKEWLDDVRRQARETGVVVSETGRRRAIPDLASPNYQLRQAAERMAVNFPVQSLSADIIKIAMVRLRGRIREAGLSGRMLLQVHDELVFEVPPVELGAFAELVPEVMTGAYQLATGLEVEAKAGPNWADLRPLARVTG